MIICHCNLITEKEIEGTIVQLLEKDPWQLIVPAKVYHTLRKRGRCCGCFPNVVETIIRVTEHYHSRLEAGGEVVVSHLDRATPSTASSTPVRPTKPRAENIRTMKPCGAP